MRKILTHIKHNERKKGPWIATTPHWEPEHLLRTLSTAHYPKNVRLPHALTSGQVNKVDHTPATPQLTELPRAPSLPPSPALHSNDEPLPIINPAGQRQEGARQRRAPSYYKPSRPATRGSKTTTSPFLL